MTVLQGTDFQMTAIRKDILEHLKKQNYDIRRKFEYCSPIVTMQKTIKAYLMKKKYAKKKKLTTLLVWGLNRWNMRRHMEALKRGLGLTPSLLHVIGTVRRI